jgi:hypothetical protein
LPEPHYQREDVAYELPQDLTTEEERAIFLALERYFTDPDGKPDPWRLSGRAVATRQQTWEARRLLPGSSWQWVKRLPLAQRSQPNLHGRGDAR